jgi:GTP cyclohydrolase II
VLTGPRAQTLGLAVPMSATVALTLPTGLEPALLRTLADVPNGSAVAALGGGLALDHAHEAERAGIELAKRAGLLPAVLALPEDAVDSVEIEVHAREVAAQRRREIDSLQVAVETRLPIAAVEDARLVVFRSAAGGSEQVALLIGKPEPADAPLCRLHSECLTGDLFGSLRCDCGEQLNGAIARMAEEGAGVLLYLRQEGRGIGLVNKLRAYQLQDRGADTLEANQQLGFDADERIYLPAAEMLRRLGFRQVRLMTNNPEKVAGLARCGIAVVERVRHVFPANGHNDHYLRTKAIKFGHLF